MQQFYLWIVYVVSQCGSAFVDSAQPVNSFSLSSWSQDRADDTDWTVMTSNKSFSSYYYVDASFSGGLARLVSPQIDIVGSACMSLDYFLTGSATDSLAIIIASNNTQPVTQFYRSVAPSTALQWETDVAVPLPAGQQLQVYIEGRTDVNGSGYIAIDNIRYSARECPDLRKVSRVSCNETSMQVAIPGTDKSKHFYFYNSPCRLTFDGAKHTATVNLNQCGLRMRKENSTTVYYAHLIEASEDDEIFDEEDLPVLLECRYDARGMTSNNVSTDTVVNPNKDYEKVIGAPQSNVTSVVLLQYPTSEYKVPYDPDQYPLEVKLGASLYFQLKAVGDTTAVQLGVTNCKAYGQDRAREYYLIKNGCVVNKSLKFLTASSDAEKRFTMKSFSLLGSEGPVHMECETLICDKGYGECASCITRRRKRAVKAKEISRSVASVGAFSATVHV